jgi:hypothetical protein
MSISNNCSLCLADTEELFIDGTDKENSNDQVVADQLIAAIVDFINNCAKHSFFMGEYVLCSSSDLISMFLVTEPNLSTKLFWTKSKIAKSMATSNDAQNIWSIVSIT